MTQSQELRMSGPLIAVTQRFSFNIITDIHNDILMRQAIRVELGFDMVPSDRNNTVGSLSSRSIPAVNTYKTKWRKKKTKKNIRGKIRLILKIELATLLSRTLHTAHEAKQKKMHLRNRKYLLQISSKEILACRIYYAHYNYDHLMILIIEKSFTIMNNPLGFLGFSISPPTV